MNTFNSLVHLICISSSIVPTTWVTFSCGILLPLPNPQRHSSVERSSRQRIDCIFWCAFRNSSKQINKLEFICFVVSNWWTGLKVAVSHFFRHFKSSHSNNSDMSPQTAFDSDIKGWFWAFVHCSRSCRSSRCPGGIVRGSTGVYGRPPAAFWPKKVFLLSGKDTFLPSCCLCVTGQFRYLEMHKIQSDIYTSDVAWIIFLFKS